MIVEKKNLRCNSKITCILRNVAEINEPWYKILQLFQLPRHEKCWKEERVMQHIKVFLDYICVLICQISSIYFAIALGGLTKYKQGWKQPFLISLVKNNPIVSYYNTVFIKIRLKKNFRLTKKSTAYHFVYT